MKENWLMKTTLKNRTALVALLFALVLSLVTELDASGPFATNYSNASLTGVYGYESFGELLGSKNPNSNTTNIPVDAVGVMSFDGFGTFKFHDSANVGGAIIQRGTADNPIVGTYAVDPDGTGTMQWFSNGGNHARAFVIVDGGRELRFDNADSTAASRGVAKKQ
jgi:hypothetical protein